MKSPTLITILLSTSLVVQMAQAAPGETAKSKPSAVKAPIPPQLTNEQLRFVIGVVDDAKLLAIRQDYPALAERVISKVAEDKKLKLVLHKQGAMWLAPNLVLADVTDEVIKRLNLLAATLPTPDGLTGAQRDAANQALKSVRKLQAAIEVGLSYNSYSERIVDIKVDVDENLRLLPDNDFKKEVNLAMEAYANARSPFRESLKGGMSEALFRPELDKFWAEATEHLEESGGVT